MNKLYINMSQKAFNSNHFKIYIYDELKVKKINRQMKYKIFYVNNISKLSSIF